MYVWVNDSDAWFREFQVGNDPTSFTQALTDLLDIIIGDSVTPNILWKVKKTYRSLIRIVNYH
jgi:hypothetical protein